MERRRLLAATPAGGELLVNTHTAGEQSMAVVATDAVGHFVVAWQSDGQDGSGLGIFAQRYSAAGVRVGGEFQVNTHTPSNQRVPAVAMDADGDFVIVWESKDQEGGVDGGDYGVYAQRYNGLGERQGDEFRVNLTTSNGQGEASVSMDAAGHFTVAWESHLQDGSEFGIYARQFSAGGMALGGELRVNTLTTGDQGRPHVAMDAAGKFVVAWHSRPGDATHYDIHAQRYDAGGAPQGSEFRVNTHTPDRQFACSVAMDDDGDFMITWESKEQDGSDYGIYAQRYDASGTAIGDEFRVNTFTTSRQARPSVASDADGEFVITWHSIGQPAPVGAAYDVYARRYNRAGAPRGDEFRVNTSTGGNQTFPAVASDDDGEFVVAWTSPRFGGSGDEASAQRFTLVPSVVQSSFQFDTAPHRMRFQFDEDVSASLGAADLVVRNDTAGTVFPVGDFVPVYDSVSDVATFRYVGTVPGVLPDGRYRATLLAGGITSAGGTPLPADHVLHFTFLRGDANGDGTVNLADFNRLAINFGQSDRTFSQGDFNYDGVVNLADFNLLAERFGTSLAAVVR